MICTSARKTHTQLAKVGRGRSTPFSPYGMNSFGPVLEENFGKETAPMDTRRGEPADAAQPDEICVAAPRAGLRAFGRRGASRRQTDNRAGRLAPVPQRRGKGNHLPTITRIFRRRLAPGWGVLGGEPASETQSRRISCPRWGVGAPRAGGLEPAGGWEPASKTRTGRILCQGGAGGFGTGMARHEWGSFCVIEGVFFGASRRGSWHPRRGWRLAPEEMDGAGFVSSDLGSCHHPSVAISGSDCLWQILTSATRQAVPRAF